MLENFHPKYWKVPVHVWACAFVCHSDGTDVLYWFCPWSFGVVFGAVYELWETSKHLRGFKAPQWLMLLVATSLRAQQSAHTWCNKILLITSGDLCTSPITPSNKHSQGGHEARKRLYKELSPDGCRVQLVFVLFSSDVWWGSWLVRHCHLVITIRFPNI